MGGGRVRLVGEVRYDGQGSKAEKFWFDLPSRFEDSISESGNPWLVCLLPLAAQRGEALRLARPVDRQLMDNAHRLMKIWRGWYPGMHEVSIEADLLPDVPGAVEGRTGAFFSGGVDSFFTVLQCARSRDAPGTLKIDDLITVWGFDIPLTDKAAFERMKRSLGEAAQSLGTGLIDVATNLRATSLHACSWPGLLHGAALASVGLVLEPYFRKLLIAATDDFSDTTPWGSHPLVDPLFSTSHTEVVLHGAKVSRIQKLETIARSEAALRALRVCWRSGDDHNCGKCAKCYCTMLHLHLLGVLDRCETFSHVRFDATRAERLYSRGPEVRAYLNAMKALAVSQGRDEIARAIEIGITRSDSWRYLPWHSADIGKKWLLGGFSPSLRYHVNRVVRKDVYRAE